MYDTINASHEDKSFTFACLGSKKIRVFLADSEEGAWLELEKEFGITCDECIDKDNCITRKLWKLVQICIY